MSGEMRCCSLCGASSTSNPTLTFHRFPKPGQNSQTVLRARVWAKYCFPSEDLMSVDSLMKLHSSHKMLCSSHFDASSYTLGAKKRLNIFSIPCGSIPILNSLKNNVVSMDSQQQVIKAASSLVTNQNQISPQVAVVEETPKRRGILNKIDVHKVTQLTPRKQKMYKHCRRNLREISRLRSKMRRLKKNGGTPNILKALAESDNVNNLVKYRMTPSFSLLMKSQISNGVRKSNGRRWNIDDKILALSIFKKSATCYRLLRQLFCLPSQGTLTSLLNKIPMKSGHNHQVSNYIAKITALRTKEDNLCVLMFDEMSIRKNVSYNKKMDQIDGFSDHGTQGRTSEIASHALVFMAAGVRKLWKQPLMFYFSGNSVTADRLSVLIKEVIRECFRIGLVVVATVCDLDGVNIKAVNKLGSCTDKPYFELDGHEIVTILDPPHLLKCFRNMFLKYDIECCQDIMNDGKRIKGVAKWKHIENFFQIDSQNPNFVFAPALSRRHLQPNGPQKMRVKLAAQVLSHTVAAGMFSKIAEHTLPADATTTATIISKIDKLFDSLNADTAFPRRGKEYSTNITTKKNYIEQFWVAMKEDFKNITFINCRVPPPSQDGWIRTINAVERLWHNLKKMKIYSLSTRRLNQDPLENLFGCIRSNCGSNPNPNICQFIAGLKTSLLSSMVQAGIKKNCEDDKVEILDDMKRFFHFEMEDDMKCDEESEVLVEAILNHVNFNNFDGTPEAQACTYVCGSIIKRQAVTCNKCKSLMLVDDMNVNHLFTDFKEYDPNKRSLKYATNNFVYCVEVCATKINQFLSNNAHFSNIKKEILKSLAVVDFSWLEECNEHFELNKKYIATAIYG